MNFWIIFALLGVLGIPFIVLTFTYAESWKSKLFYSSVIFVIWLIVACSCTFGHNVNVDKWNNGYCQCGTHWELRGASEYRSSHTKYYVCPNCYAEIELNY